MLVEALMTPAPVTATSTTPIREIRTLMHEHGIRHVPIVDGDELFGIVSERDLTFLYAMPHVLPQIEPSAIEAALENPVSSVMKLRFVVDRDVITITPGDRVATAIERMLEHRLSALPVVRPGTRQVVGILSQVDVLGAAARLFAPAG